MSNENKAKSWIYPSIRTISIIFLTIIIVVIIQNIIINVKTDKLLLSNKMNIKDDKFIDDTIALRSAIKQMNKQRISRTNSTFNYQNKTFETIIQCVGPLYNQSCLYKNLYYVNKTFMILAVKGRQLPNYSVRTNAFSLYDKTIKKREFKSYPDLEKFVLNLIDLKRVPSVTLYFGQLWHQNIGHALFDGLYPAYVALIRFSPRHLQPFRILTEIRNCKDCWSEDVYSRFSGLGIMKIAVLDEMSKQKWFLFDEIIMGSGKLCQRCVQSNLQLPGGVELDASRLFRDRMYQQHGLIQSTIRKNSSSEHRKSSDILQAYIIHNKRFTTNDRIEINDTMNELNNYTNFYLNKTIKKRKWPLIHVTYLHYNKIQGQDPNSFRINATPIDSRSPIYELIDNNFMTQLRTVRQMDIHITGPGTGQMYQTFLSDGSVTINVGGLKSKNKFTSYMEQHMTSGTPYIKGLYYPINKRSKGIKKDELIKLIRQAGQLILQGFSLPVNPRENLALDGQLFVEMCEKDKKFCSLVTDRSPNNTFACVDFWPEDFVHEHNQWKKGGYIRNGRRVTCPFNRSLFYELREKYGIKYKDPVD
ncbi:unnamed protein product [Adineta steineri]|uniref:Uncharacterized protein n=1 Tax=Adineta steineri TaxID=433720 RepID=A0A814HYC1_9BILA|nr:unnamed protein product [Adineta steineri]CAF1600261.1 unnamed protein product [Adineta steineri]